MYVLFLKYQFHILIDLCGSLLILKLASLLQKKQITFEKLYFVNLTTCWISKLFAKFGKPQKWQVLYSLQSSLQTFSQKSTAEHH